MSEIEMQKVWRTLSNDTSGYYVWEVLEVVGKVTRILPSYTPTVEGSYISEQCYHFWTKEKAEQFLKANEMSEWQTVEFISGPIKRGDWVKSTYLNLMGVVEDVGICRNPYCIKTELTLDRNGKGTRFYHHTEHFELMTEEEIMKEIREPSPETNEDSILSEYGGTFDDCR